MGQVWAVFLNEWMKLRYRARFWIVVVIAILSVVGLSVLMNSSQMTAEEHLKMMNEDIKQAQLELNEIETKGTYLGEKIRSKEEKEILIRDLKMRIENQQTNIQLFNERLTGDWKKAIRDQYESEQIQQQEIEQNYHDEEMMGQQDDTMVAEQQRQKLIRDYMLNLTERPAPDFVDTAYTLTKNQIGITSLVLLPFLVIILVADLVSGESTSGTIKLLLVRPVSRSKVLIGKWLTGVLASMILVVFYFGATFLTNVAFHGADGGSSPEVVNVGLKEGKVYDYETQGLKKQLILDYSQAEAISVREYLGWSFLFTLVSVIVIATVAFFASVLFKSAMVSTAVSVAFVILGTIISQIESAGKYMFWFFGMYGNLTHVWIGIFGETIQRDITLSTSLMILGTWFLASLLLSFVIFRRRDILNA